MFTELNISPVKRASVDPTDSTLGWSTRILARTALMPEGLATEPQSPKLGNNLGTKIDEYRAKP